MRSVCRPSRRFCAVLLAVACAAWSHASADTEVLRILSWPGYADPDVIKAFERRHGVRAEITLIDSDVDLWNKVNRNRGKDYDVFAVNTAELQRYIRDGLAAPLDPAAIPNLARQLPRFRDAAAVPGIAHDGKRYAVPYTYAEMGLIFDPAQIDPPPDSITALWDPRYRGKVIAYNGGTHNFALAAQSLGWPDPFRIDDALWPTAVDRLIALRRNAAAFYTQPEESVALFVQRKAALMYANFGSQQIKLLQTAGASVGYALPKEGALAWLDCWVMTTGARNPRLAAAWINALLDAPASDALVARQGLSNTTAESPFLKASTRIVWLEAVENENRRNQLWGRIISGDRAAKVLRP